jgi:hypothetical protein
MMPRKAERSQEEAEQAVALAYRRLAQERSRVLKLVRSDVEIRIATERGFHIDPATPETRAKFRKSTLAFLVDNNRIGPEELQAAAEIEAVYRHLCARLFAQQIRYSERVDKSTTHDPAWFLDAYETRYKPWMNSFTGIGKAAMGGDVCISIIVDGRFARDIDRENGWRHGTSMGILSTALHNYAVMAGWLRRRS